MSCFIVCNETISNVVELLEVCLDVDRDACMKELYKLNVKSYKECYRDEDVTELLELSPKYTKNPVNDNLALIISTLCYLYNSDNGAVKDTMLFKFLHTCCYAAMIVAFTQLTGKKRLKQNFEELRSFFLKMSNADPKYKNLWR